MSTNKKATFKHSLKAVIASNQFKRALGQSAPTAAASPTPTSSSQASPTAPGPVLSLRSPSLDSPAERHPSDRDDLEDYDVFNDIHMAARMAEDSLVNTPNALLSDDINNNAAQLAGSCAGAEGNSAEKRIAHAARVEIKQLVPNMRKLIEHTMEATFKAKNASTPPGCVKAGSSWIHKESLTLLHVWHSAGAARRFQKAITEVANVLLSYRIDGIYSPYQITCKIHGQFVSAVAVPPLLIKNAPEVIFYVPSGKEHPAPAPASKEVAIDVVTNGTQTGAPSSVLELMATQLHTALRMDPDKPIRLKRGIDGRYYFACFKEFIESRAVVPVSGPSPAYKSGASPPDSGPASAKGSMVLSKGLSFAAVGSGAFAPQLPFDMDMAEHFIFTRPEAAEAYHVDKKKKTPAGGNNKASGMTGYFTRAEHLTLVLVPRAGRDLLAQYTKLPVAEKAVGAVLSSNVISRTMHKHGVNTCLLYKVEEFLVSCQTEVPVEKIEELIGAIQSEIVGRSLGSMACIDIDNMKREGNDTLTDRVDVVNRVASFAVSKDEEFWEEHLMGFIREKFGAPSSYKIKPDSTHSATLLKRLANATGCEFDPNRGRFERFIQIPITKTSRPTGWYPDEESLYRETKLVPESKEFKEVLLKRKQQLADEFWAKTRAEAELETNEMNPHLFFALAAKASSASIEIGRGAEAVNQLVASQAVAMSKRPQHSTEVTLAMMLVFRLRIIATEAVAVEKRLDEVEQLEHILLGFHEGDYHRSEDGEKYHDERALPFDADALNAVAFQCTGYHLSTRARPEPVHVAIVCHTLAAYMMSEYHTDFRVNTTVSSLVTQMEPMVTTIDDEASLRSVYVLAEQIANRLAKLNAKYEAIRYLERVLWKAIGTPSEAYKATAMLGILIGEKMKQWECVDKFDRCVALYIAALSTMCVITKHKQETLAMTNEDATILTRRTKLRDTIRKCMERIRNVHADQFMVAATNNVPLTLIYRVQQLLKSDEEGIELFGHDPLAKHKSMARFERRASVGGSSLMGLNTSVGSMESSIRSGSVDLGADAVVSSPAAMKRLEDQAPARLALLIEDHLKAISPKFHATVMLQRVIRGYNVGRHRDSEIGHLLKQRNDRWDVEQAEKQPREGIEDEERRHFLKLFKKEAEERKLIARGRKVGSVWGVVAKTAMVTKKKEDTPPPEEEKKKKKPKPTQEEAEKRPQLDLSELRRRLGRYYAKYQPDKSAEQIDKLLFDKYFEKEWKLVDKLKEKYGDSPLDYPYSDEAAALEAEERRKKRLAEEEEERKRRVAAGTPPPRFLQPLPDGEQGPKRIRKAFTPEPIIVIPEKLETRIYSVDEIRERMEKAEGRSKKFFLNRKGLTKDGLPDLNKLSTAKVTVINPSTKKNVHHLKPLPAGSKPTSVPRARSSHR